MNESTILIEKNKTIATITLNRAAVCNALNAELMTELKQSLQEISCDLSIQLVILQARGKHFCAGADLQWIQQMADADTQENMALLSQVMHTLYHLPQITIALVQGSAYGGGVGLIACCDFGIASADADFCFSEVSLGLIPAVISPYIIKAIGERTAKRYFITAQKINAEQALAMGLINDIVEPTALQETAHKLAQTIINNSPKAVSEAKRLCQHVGSHKMGDKLNVALVEWIAATSRSDEAQQRLKAFLAKKK